MSRDMSGRFEPIYRQLIQPQGKPGPSGVTVFDFTEKSGYMNEVLAVAERPAGDPFVARCLTGTSDKLSLLLASSKPIVPMRLNWPLCFLMTGKVEVLAQNFSAIY